MKAKFILYSILGLIISNNSFALSPKDDWNALRNNNKVNILEPEFTKAYGGIFNMCYEGENFKSVEPVKVCIGAKEIVLAPANTELGLLTKDVCSKVEMRDVEFSREFNREICTEYIAPTEATSNECLEYTSQNVTLPTQYKLDIVHRKGLLFGNHIFFKSYQIPPCNNI